MLECVRTLKARGATLRATDQPIDTSTAAGKWFLDMLGVFAEFETNLRRERQVEGVKVRPETTARIAASTLLRPPRSRYGCWGPSWRRFTGRAEDAK